MAFPSAAQRKAIFFLPCADFLCILSLRNPLCGSAEVPLTTVPIYKPKSFTNSWSTKGGERLKWYSVRVTGVGGRRWAVALGGGEGKRTKTWSGNKCNHHFLFFWDMFWSCYRSFWKQLQNMFLVYNFQILSNCKDDRKILTKI